MFDIGFWELCLIGVIALVVVGPERLPGLIKSTGYWLGRFRQMASNVKSEIQTEVEKAEQLKHLMQEQEDIVKRHAELEKKRIIGEEEQAFDVSSNRAQSQQVDALSSSVSETESKEQKPNG